MNSLLDLIVEKNRPLTTKGRVATYIPGLSKSDINHLGICVMDCEGNIFQSGESDVKFTIQSVSKPIGFMLAVLDNSLEEVFSKVGMEPTGDPFNSIVRLETNKSKGKPYNPLINAGAIQMCSMIKGDTHEERFERVLNFFRTVSENPTLQINEEIYQGEKRTGDRNRSMAYFLKCEGLLQGEVTDALEIYFKQCSIEVTAKDLAQIALFLARDGVLSNGVKVVDSKVCRIAKSLMTTCGMYDGSGEFATKVGIPSKSGVGGGIMSAVPGKYGIGVFGPSLDEKGNSIAGIQVLTDLSENFDLSIF